MLPDFLALKVKLLKEQSYAVIHDRSGEPLLSRIATHVNHEGNGFLMIREDGSQDATDFERVTAELVIEIKDLQERGQIAIDEAVNAAGRQIQETSKKMLFDTLNTTVPGHDAGGRPFSAELMLETWETMEFSFDEEGNWEQPVLVANPVHATRISKEFKRFEGEPKLRKQRDELIARKRMAWNDREANRKLVD